MNKNFLHVYDLNIDQFNSLLEKAKWIKNKFKQNEIYHPFKNKTMSIELVDPPVGVSAEGLVSIVRRLEKKLGFKASAVPAVGGGLVFVFVDLSLKNGVVVCRAFDSLFSRVITK